MAATIQQTPSYQDPTSPEHNGLIIAAETNQLKNGTGRLFVLHIWTAAASGITVDIYDATAGTTLNIWRRVVPASTNITDYLLLPFANGLRVITSGASGTFGVNVGYS